MSYRVKTAVLLVAAVVAIAAAVFANGRTQRAALTHSLGETVAAQAMLTAMIDQETGLRGYLQTGREEFLEPYVRGGRSFVTAVERARAATPASQPEQARAIGRVEALGQRWRAEAERTLGRVRATGDRRVRIADALRRKEHMDRLRAVSAELQRLISAEREERMDAASRAAVLLVLGVSALFAAGGWIVFGRRAVRQARRAEREQRLRDGQSEFNATLALMDSEPDTHALLKRHLERSLPGSEVHVMNRDDSAARLEAATPVAADSPLAVQLVDAEPRSCLAVRLGRGHASGDDDALLACGLCGATGRDRTTCTPLVVSGEVIGSVLVAHDEPLGRDDRRAVTDSVVQAAPVLANLRTLAVAERRAATDVLTGLPNRRLGQETLKRMVAHAARTGAGLAVVAIDVDHFKQVNDVHGHDAGDQVLAAVGRALAGTLRASDFVARLGGEEFVALLPDTDAEGAVVAAEHLRRAVAGVAVAGLDRRVTASFGVAAFPEDGRDPETLLKLADRALYAAKERGRDRVEAARCGLPA